MEIIDAHSHIGSDLYFGKGKLEEYIQFCKKIGITESLLMPQPNCFYVINGKKIPCVSWTFDGNKMIYNTYDGKNINPYKYLNYYYYCELKKIKNHKSHFIPLIHPVLDRIEYIEELITKIRPKALKIHGMGSGVSPEDISEELIVLLKKYNIPLIVHCEYDSRKSNNYEIGKKILKTKNSAFNWANLFVNKGLKGVLTHGAGIDRRVLQLLRNNKGKNIMIGIGPDLFISYLRYKFDNYESQEEYLELIKRYVPIDKIVFDVDYDWNIVPTDNNGRIDEEVVRRIKKVWSSEVEQNKIFYDNSRKFFGLEKENNLTREDGK